LPPHPNAEEELARLYQTTRLLKAAQSRPQDELLLMNLGQELKDSPVQRVSDLMEKAGILDALDDAPGPIFRGFRRSAVPPEDWEFLSRAGFSDDEIEILFVIAEEGAEELGYATHRPSRILSDASDALSGPQSIVGPQVDERKKRKILNGIGKILGGAVAGTGNVLIATGAIIVPAAGAAAIASGGLAISSIFAGLGDLRGE